MSLLKQKFLFLDCQTTGMRPPTGALLELGWGVASAEEQGAVMSRIVKLPEGHWLPGKVKEITGIRESMLEEGVAEEELLGLLDIACVSSEAAPALVHYAQFERAFLDDFFVRQGRELPFPFICTYRIARKLYPNVPSRNIRGILGYLGFPFREIKRAEAHVRATMEVWSELAKELAVLGIHDLAALNAWLEEKPKPKKKGAAPVKFEYRVDRMKRLELPPRPGVYRMISKSGDILYVGKATSLKDRVNSYFRGKKGRDPKKLEMMAQVWDLEVTECGSPLEAALLETDEIKRLDPPYNISLKAGRRELHFYNRDFTATSAEQSAEFCQGPHRSSNGIEQVRQLLGEVNEAQAKRVLYEPIAEETYASGYALFAAKNFPELAAPTARQLIALGMHSLRRLKKAAEVEEEAVEELMEEEAAATEEAEAAEAAESAEPLEELAVDLSPEEVAEKLDRVLLRAALDYRRAKGLTRMLNAEVRWQGAEGERVLRFRNGKMNADEPDGSEFPWRALGIQDYDRMSVLISEVQKGDYRVERYGGRA
ncbi:MAG: hypothetical protein EOP11_04690 [Proteobacteria bacterium]|nr:MAG: hypothetical protein EOP11_04690 [Pseudomonadota bacterium]